MTEFDCSISFEDTPGEVEFVERGAKDKHGYFKIGETLFAAPHNISLTLTYEDGGARFGIDSSHMENKEISRAFHAHFKWTLGQQDVAKLRDFLAMIAKWEDEE